MLIQPEACKMQVHCQKPENAGPLSEACKMQVHCQKLLLTPLQIYCLIITMSLHMFDFHIFSSSSKYEQLVARAFTVYHTQVHFS